MKLRVLVLAFLTLAACISSIPTSPIAPPGAHRVSPRPEWREWHTELVACVGRERPFEVISWYVVPGESWDSSGEELVGQFWRVGTRIYLSEDMLEKGGWTSKWLVKHEMTHFLLSPVSGHPSPPFRGCEFF